MLTALLLQATLEFGPLWLVALSASTALYGPHWAGLMAALGLGGLLGGRLVLSRRPATAAVIAATIVGCCVVLTASHAIGIVIVAQVLLVLLVVAVSIPVTGRLHDAIPSTIRAGVASGVGTLTWLTFLPFAFAFGAVSDRSGVARSRMDLWGRGRARRRPDGRDRPWLRACARRRAAGAGVRSRPVPARRRPPVAGSLGGAARALGPLGQRIATDVAMGEARDAIADLPSPQHDVIVARDVDGRSPAEVRDELDLTASEEASCSTRLAATSAPDWTTT